MNLQLPDVGTAKVKLSPNLATTGLPSPAPVGKIYGRTLDGGAAISQNIDLAATRIDANDRRRSLESVPGKNQIASSRREGHRR